jgi:hypothetical protein
VAATANTIVTGAAEPATEELGGDEGEAKQVLPSPPASVVVVRHERHSGLIWARGAGEGAAAMMTELSADEHVHALPTQSVLAQTLPALVPAAAVPAAQLQHPVETPVGLAMIVSISALVHTQSAVGGVQV